MRRNNRLRRLISRREGLPGGAEPCSARGERRMKSAECRRQRSRVFQGERGAPSGPISGEFQRRPLSDWRHASDGTCVAPSGPMGSAPICCGRVRRHRRDRWRECGRTGALAATWCDARLLPDWSSHLAYAFTGGGEPTGSVLLEVEAFSEGKFHQCAPSLFSGPGGAWTGD